jgi:predicted amino acid racemase
MPAPRIEIELEKLAHNARKLIALYGSKGICVTAVTKGVCGSPRIAKIPKSPLSDFLPGRRLNAARSSASFC